MEQTGISVIICCHNSDWVISRTLSALANQKSPECAWELILVDNNSSDRTREIFQIFQAEHVQVDARYVFEIKQGLSYARIAGYSAAKYPILIFCDDDTLFCAEYLAVAFRYMNYHSQVGLCGGCGTAVFEVQPDSRVLPFLDHYATGPQAPESPCDITERGFVFGAGMVVRKSAMDIILECGFEFASLGRTGKMLTGGEDVELGHAIREAGFRIHYLADLKYEHILPARRLTWDYLNRMTYGSGYSSAVMPWPTTLFSFKSHPCYVAAWSIVEFLRRGVPCWLGRATPQHELDFSVVCGRLQGVLCEFFGLFETRRKARGFYRNLMAHAREKSGLPQ
jgi:glycosyltransferase involved in cell wall biosynthesis